MTRDGFLRLEGVKGLSRLVGPFAIKRSRWHRLLARLRFIWESPEQGLRRG
jgi:hypothetical protein